MRALTLHPDRGGSDGAMAALIDAYRAALETAGRPKEEKRHSRRVRTEREVASFTVDELPVVAFEGLRIAASVLGDIVDEEPPYMIEFIVRENGGTWCRCDLVPDAGASTVSVAVTALSDSPSLDCEGLRDILVEELNRLDWDSATS